MYIMNYAQSTAFMNIEILKKLGMSDKIAEIYQVLLSLGPSSVRSLAEVSGLNRGSAYDALKWLEERGLVTFYHKDTKQFFVAEHPDQLLALVREKKTAAEIVERELEKALPELLALHHTGGERPVARYVSSDELNSILEDVLYTCEESEEKMYRIYSAEGVREFLYEQFPTFSDARVAKGIAVRAIAIGDGGELRGLDERKWLSSRENLSTYIIIYPGKTAYISLDRKKQPIGVVIENEGIYRTERQVFDSLWEKI